MVVIDGKFRDKSNANTLFGRSTGYMLFDSMLLFDFFPEILEN